MSKDAYYFSHDSNARNDPKIILLCSKFGIVAYAYFFILIEILREQNNYCLSKEYIAVITNAWQCYGNAITEPMAQSIIDFMCVHKLIILDENGYYYSESLNRRMSILDEMRIKKSNAGKKGAAVLWQCHNSAITLPMAQDDKVKESKVKESKRKESKVKENDNIPYKEIIEDLNSVLGTVYKDTTETTRERIRARWKEGHTLEAFKKVHRNKHAEWGDDDKMCKFLRPETLYGTKFESYLNQKEFKIPEKDIMNVEESWL